MVDEMVKKRFTNINEDIFQYGEWYCSAGGVHCADVIATALNELITENERLKLGCKKVEKIDDILDEISSSEYLSRDDCIKALDRIDKVVR